MRPQAGLVMSTFRALLHHGDLTRDAVDFMDAAEEAQDVPPLVGKAYEIAYVICDAERTISSDIG